MTLKPRAWVPPAVDSYVDRVASATASATAGEVTAQIDALIAQNRTIHEVECLNLNPATNAMNPRAEAALGAGLGQRPSLGYPGEKYEMGLEAIEQVEIITAQLAADVFNADYAEIRVPSGAIANLYAFMAFAQPGDSIIAPPPTIGGHVTHHRAGAAGLYGLDIHAAPIDAARYTVDVDALRSMAHTVKPKVITIGASLNLFHHPVADIRTIADEVGAMVLFDAAHLSGVIAGGAWPNPLADGAHLMTMSTYKSLGGPPSGLLVTNDAAVAERLDAIAYPGLTANFDAGKAASLAITLLDWKTHGTEYATAMVAAAQALAAALVDLGVPVHASADGATQSHAFALDATVHGGGHQAALMLRKVNLLACAIGLPTDGPDQGNGLRIGSNEATRWGMTVDHMPQLAEFIADGLAAQNEAAIDGIRQAVIEFRSGFTDLHFINH